MYFYWFLCLENGGAPCPFLRIEPEGGLATDLISFPVPGLGWGQRVSALSFSVEWWVTAKIRSRKSRRRRGSVVKTQTDACDELPGTKSWGVASLCWAGEVGDERQATVATGRRSLGHRRAQTLPSAWPVPTFVHLFFSPFLLIWPTVYFLSIWYLTCITPIWWFQYILTS